MWFAAFICGVWLMTRIGRRDGLTDDQLTAMLFYVFFGTLIGARLGHCVFYEWGYYKDHLLEMILPVQFSPKFRITGYEGLASHGAAIGIVVAMLLFARKIKKPFLWIMDRLCIVVALGGMFIRLGNFFNSEIIGKPTGRPSGVIFKRLVKTFPVIGPTLRRSLRVPDPVFRPVGSLQKRLRAKSRFPLRNIPDRSLHDPLCHRIFQRKPSGFRGCLALEHGTVAQHSFYSGRRGDPVFLAETIA